ncbi:MAG TPA: TerC family protein [Gemmatimonadaceae bacterium]|nr:TerC family protein [Gemmatimonadaceae bacterium]
MMHATIWHWIGFNAAILLLLALDLGVFNRNAHEIHTREAAVWSAGWVLLSLLFAAGLAVLSGGRYALEFLSGYLVEKSLSVDNIFVFVMIFRYFAVPARYQHRVLYWGILGALVLRGIFIGLGTYMLHRFEWVTYVFGALLLFTGVRMALHDEGQTDYARTRIVRLARRVIPMTKKLREGRLVVHERGRWKATPLLLVLLVVESSDLLFAVDSIPAVFAVTRDPFLVYTSNVFAILGLRALYFLLAGIIDRFHYLRFGLAVILVFVGIKMVTSNLFEIPIWLSLLVITVVLAVSVAASLAWKPPATDASATSERTG